MRRARAAMLLGIAAMACAPVATGHERQAPAMVAASTGEITVDVYELI